MRGTTAVADDEKAEVAGSEGADAPLTVEGGSGPSMSQGRMASPALRVGWSGEP